MRLLKLSGLAALLAMAMMSFAGVGTAAAEHTVMCKVNQSPCPAESIFTQGTHGTETGTEIKAEAVNPHLKVYEDAAQTKIKDEVLCERSNVVGWYQEQGTQEAPQHKGEIKKLTFSGNCHLAKTLNSTCKSPGAAAGEIVGLQLPYQTLLSWTSGQSGRLIIYEQATNGQPGATVECKVGLITVLNCTYKVQEPETQEPAKGKEVGHMEVIGGKPTIIKANQLELKWSGPLCFGAPEAKWDAEYNVTSPVEGWVSTAP